MGPMDAANDVVGRVAALLRAVSAHEPRGASTTILGRDVGLARATCHRLLSSLADHGLLDREPASGRWRLGPETYLFGLAVAARYDVTEIARPTVQRLARLTGESAFFSVRRGDETVCLIREDGSFPIRSHVLYEGIRFPLGVASAGLAVLAFLAERDREDFLDRTDLTEQYGQNHTADDLRRRVTSTHTTGYAVNPGLIVPDSWGLAAAVFDVAGRPQWALSLTGIASRFAPPRQQELGQLLLREAHDLTPQLGERQGGR
jgi:DNA-binding IclR family transcriptional regulator